MAVFPLFNDFQVRTEAVPGSAPPVFFGEDASSPIPAGRAGRIVVSGTVHHAQETSGLLQFQLRVVVQGSNDACTWAPLGTAVDALIATFIDMTGTRSGAPNRFVTPSFSIAGFAWVRALWVLYPLAPATALGTGQHVTLTALAGLGEG
jgi:hypothetical protein